MKTEIDEGFIGRVYKTSLFVWAFGALAAFSAWGPYAAAGWTMGSALSVGVLRSLEVAVRRYFVPGRPGARLALTKVSLVKLAAVLVVLGLVVWIGKHSFAFVAAFCAGVLLTQTVMFLKVIGMLICERLNG